MTLHGLAPEEARLPWRLSDGEFQQARERSGALVAEAAGELDRLFAIIGKSGCCLLLTDEKGIALERRGARVLAERRRRARERKNEGHAEGRAAAHRDKDDTAIRYKVHTLTTAPPGAREPRRSILPPSYAQPLGHAERIAAAGFRVIMPDLRALDPALRERIIENVHSVRFEDWARMWNIDVTELRPDEADLWLASAIVHPERLDSGYLGGEDDREEGEAEAGGQQARKTREERGRDVVVHRALVGSGAGPATPAVCVGPFIGPRAPKFTVS